MLGSAVLLVAPMVAAEAPIGTDPQYEAYTRFTPEIVDRKTALTWERFTLPTEVDLATATSHCASFGGRVPTVKELLTIVDEDPHEYYDQKLARVVSKAISQGAFGENTQPRAYWTSTPADVADETWGVDFEDGTTARLKTSSGKAFLRCVRGG
jgi:hypothetical protein